MIKSPPDFDNGIEIKLDCISVRTNSNATILNNIGFKIAKGELVAILGQSGAGKTTLLRSMACLLKPYKNRVLFNNYDFFSLKKKDKLLLRRKISFIPQQFKLIKELSVFENVMIGRLGYMKSIYSILHKYPHNHKELVLECISKVKLSDKQNVPAKRLSGGEQQRVAIARCLAQEPSVILADEPMASLDISLASTILEILKDENIKGKTVIFVVHDIDMALKYANRVILIKNGQIISDNLVKDINNDFIKGFFN